MLIFVTCIFSLIMDISTAMIMTKCSDSDSIVGYVDDIKDTKLPSNK